MWDTYSEWQNCGASSIAEITNLPSARTIRIMSVMLVLWTSSVCVIGLQLELVLTDRNRTNQKALSGVHIHSQKHENGPEFSLEQRLEIEESKETAHRRQTTQIQTRGMDPTGLIPGM